MPQVKEKRQYSPDVGLQDVEHASSILLVCSRLEACGVRLLPLCRRQFMVGDAVLVSPAVSINATQTAAYFPKARCWGCSRSRLWLQQGSERTDRWRPHTSRPFHARKPFLSTPAALQGLWYNVWNWSEAIDARQGPLNLTLAVSNSTDAATNVTTYYTPAHIRQAAAGCRTALRRR